VDRHRERRELVRIVGCCLHDHYPSTKLWSSQPKHRDHARSALRQPVRVGAMLLREVEYARPDTIDEAVRLLSSREDARVLAGGQSLVNVMKTRVAAPELVVELNRVQELSA